MKTKGFLFLLLLLLSGELPARWTHYRRGSARRLTPEELHKLNIALMILSLLLLTVVIVLVYLYVTKESRNKKKIEKRRALDPFWDHEKIIHHAKLFYVEFHKHWSAGSVKAIEHQLTAPFFRQQQRLLGLYRRRGLAYAVEDIRVEGASILKFEDYLDDSKDAVSVIVTGELKEHIGSEGNKRKYNQGEFRNVLVFFRKGDSLLLGEIIDEISDTDIAITGNIIE